MWWILPPERTIFDLCPLARLLPGKVHVHRTGNDMAEPLNIGMHNPPRTASKVH
jgi:hypothetical protein